MRSLMQVGAKLSVVREIVVELSGWENELQGPCVRCGPSQQFWATAP